ncbi:MAG TPA: protein kinase [Pirellulales bacterium]|nr:protein kinase [Pirellulales bacterium]
MPRFEQVWVDALAQARVITPFQAAEINAGRGEALALGPYVLAQPLESLGWAVGHRARDVGRKCDVRIVVAAVGNEADDARRQARTEALADLLRRSAQINHRAVEPIEAFGFAGDRLWAASAYSPGQSAGEWMIHHGRLSPAAVREIARQMVDGLAACEAAGVVHGDISARQLWFQAEGQVRLLGAGLRGIVQPTESYAAGNLLPDAYDYLAPERIADGTGPTVASDIYACGALWWHLLAGRAPVAGATGLAKMQAIQMGRVADVAQLVPETPQDVQELVRVCMARDVQQRPRSLAALATRFGGVAGAQENTLVGEKLLARSLDRSSQCRLRLGQAPEARNLRSRLLRAGAVTTGCLLVLIAATWPQWQARLSRAVTDRMKRDAPVAATPSAPAQTHSALAQGPRKPAVPGTERVGPWPGAMWEENELVLDASGPIDVSNIPLRTAQVVRARAHARAEVRVPPEGWRIEADEVRFQDIDFVAASPDTAAMVVLACRRAEFRGCSWQAARGGKSTAAIGWTRDEKADEVDDMLVAGEVRLSDCLLQQLGAGVRWSQPGSVVIELANVLCLGPGSLVAFDRPPEGDESLELIVSHVTLRDANALVSCACRQIPADPGRLIISAKDCAFMPTVDTGLIVFDGPTPPGALLQGLEWVGQGSVLSHAVPLAVWRDAKGELHAAADESVQAAGLVRSDVGFAGDKSAGPAASRIVRWQVPLQSTEPPGIRESKPLPSGALR